MAKRFCIDYQLLLLFSHSVVSDSLWPHGLQHTRFPRPSLSPGVCSNSCSLSWWCHPTISSSVIPSPPALNLYQHQSFPVSWLSASCGQSIGALASVLQMNIQGWSLLGLTGLISLLSRGLWRIFSSTTVRKHQFFGAQLSLWSNSHPYMSTGKTVVLTVWTFVDEVMPLLFFFLL